MLTRLPTSVWRNSARVIVDIEVFKGSGKAREEGENISDGKRSCEEAVTKVETEHAPSLQCVDLANFNLTWSFFNQLVLFRNYD